MIIILLFRVNSDHFAYFIIAALVLLQGILIYQYWGFANSKENRLSLQDKYFEIDSDRLVVNSADGISASIETGIFKSVLKTSKYYLLYTSKTEFIYLTVNSFKSVEDREWFEHEIIAKIKK